MRAIERHSSPACPATDNDRSQREHRSLRLFVPCLTLIAFSLKLCADRTDAVTEFRELRGSTLADRLFDTFTRR